MPPPRTGRVRSGPSFVATLLVGVQFAAASFLLVVLIVVHAQNNELRRAGLGMTGDAVVVITNKIGAQGPALTTLRSELSSHPQIKALTAIDQPPWSVGAEVWALSRSREESFSNHSMVINHVGLDFFDVLDMKLLAGRSFRGEHGEDTMPLSLPDWDPQRTANVVIDNALALQMGFASPREAVDKIVYIPESIMRTLGKPAIGVRIIGVVENKPLRVVAYGNNSNLYTLTDADMYPVVRISGTDIPAGVAAITDSWERLSPSIPVKLRFMDDLFEESYEIFGRINQLFAGLSAFAFIIAIIGLVAMALYVTSRRTHEIGVRKTLGATVGGILWMLLRDFSVPVVVGNLVAWPLAFVVMQKYLSTFTHRIELSFLPFALSLLVTVLIAWLAVSGHALRAARVRPAAVLRYE
jgi:putative ABC transport system permease protein